MALRRIFLHAETMDQTTQSGADTFIPDILLPEERKCLAKDAGFILKNTKSNVLNIARAIQ